MVIYNNKVLIQAEFEDGFTACHWGRNEQEAVEYLYDNYALVHGEMIFYSEVDLMLDD